MANKTVADMIHPEPETPSLRNAAVVAGFTRAVQALQGGIPAAWRDADHVARVLADGVPRLTVARLIVWCREQQQDLAVVAAKVLTDVLATEPGLMELGPAEAAEEGAALVQAMWPQAAFMQRRPPKAEPEESTAHPVLDQLRALGAQWRRLAVLPINQARTAGPASWRSKIIKDIAQAKAEGLRAGLTRTHMLAALESAGDRWTWDIPPPAKDYNLDEFGTPPEGTEQTIAAVQS